MAAPENRREAFCAVEAILSGGITPGITRRPKPLRVFDKQRVGGRVHAVVRRAVTYHFARAERRSSRIKSTSAEYSLGRELSIFVTPVAVSAPIGRGSSSFKNSLKTRTISPSTLVVLH